jgi:hypothetical protein
LVIGIEGARAVGEAAVDSEAASQLQGPGAGVIDIVEIGGSTALQGLRAAAFVTGAHDPLTDILRVSFHASSPFLLL